MSVSQHIVSYRRSISEKLNLTVHAYNHDSFTYLYRICRALFCECDNVVNYDSSDQISEVEIILSGELIYTYLVSGRVV